MGGNSRAELVYPLPAWAIVLGLYLGDSFVHVWQR
jgi:hypothetical protein